MTPHAHSETAGIFPERFLKEQQLQTETHTPLKHTAPRLSVQNTTRKRGGRNFFTSARRQVFLVYNNRLEIKLFWQFQMDVVLYYDTELHKCASGGFLSTVSK